MYMWGQVYDYVCVWGCISVYVIGVCEQMHIWMWKLFCESVFAFVQMQNVFVCDARVTVFWEYLCKNGGLCVDAGAHVCICVDMCMLTTRHVIVLKEHANSLEESVG